MSALVSKVRPAHKVRDYLLKEFGGNQGTPAKRLPTIREVADHLQISFGTVQSVYKSLAKEGYIRTRAGVGSFIHLKSASGERTLQIAMNIQPKEGPHLKPLWIDGIYRGILDAIVKGSAHINLLALPEGEKGERLFAQKIKNGECDGLLMLAPTEQKPMEELAIQHGIPLIHLRMSTIDTTMNFVSPNFYEFARVAGEAFAEGGRRHILCVSNKSMKQNAGNNLLFTGLAAGLDEELMRGADLRYFYVSSPKSLREELGQFFAQSGFVPDAIFCAGDYMAIEVLEMATKMGWSVPDQISVIGATGLDLSHTKWPMLTRVYHPFHEIGEALIGRLIQRIQKNGADIPGVYISFHYGGGGTTTARENQRLGIQETMTDHFQESH